jgi:hypothetical protein
MEFAFPHLTISKSPILTGSRRSLTSSNGLTKPQREPSCSLAARTVLFVHPSARGISWGNSRFAKGKLMRSNLQEQSEVPGATRAGNALPLSWHAFVTIGARACCALALLSLRKPSLYAADKSGSTNTASTSPSSNFRQKAKRLARSPCPASLRLTPSRSSNSPQYPMKSPVKLAPNNPTPGALGIFMIVASSTASVVTRGSSVQTQSLIPEPAGAAFWQPIARENIVEIKDRRLGIVRTAVPCRRCDVHLGRVFDDGPQPTGLRYCMNSAVMHFVKAA